MKFDTGMTRLGLNIDEADEAFKILSKNNEINFFFAGGGVITLISESIEAVMHDLGEPWNVRHTPKHKI